MIIIPAHAPVTVLWINHIVANSFLGMTVREHNVRAAVVAIRRPLLALRIVRAIVLGWVQVRGKEAGRPAVCEHNHPRWSHDLAPPDGGAVVDVAAKAQLRVLSRRPQAPIIISQGKIRLGRVNPPRIPTWTRWPTLCRLHPE